MRFVPAERPMSPEDVLASIRESFRQQVEYDPEAALSRGSELTFDTTVAQWRETCDLLEWCALGSGLNKCYDVQFSPDEWRQALCPERQRTIRDVCALIARQARAPVIEPICALGARCGAAGAFLLVRHALQAAGACVEELRPSSPMQPWLRRHCGAVLLLAEKVAPGKLPPIRIQNSVYDASMWVYLLGFFVILTGFCTGRLGSVLLAGGILAAIGYAGMWFFAGRPTLVQFGDLRTFRELSYALAGETPRPRKYRVDSPGSA